VLPPQTDNSATSFAELTLAYFGEPLRMKDVFARIGVADPFTASRRPPASSSTAPRQGARHEGSPAEPK
jgi:hypothetical protein